MQKPENLPPQREAWGSASPETVQRTAGDFIAPAPKNLRREMWHVGSSNSHQTGPRRRLLRSRRKTRFFSILFCAIKKVWPPEENHPAGIANRTFWRAGSLRPTMRGICHRRRSPTSSEGGFGTVQKSEKPDSRFGNPQNKKADTDFSVSAGFYGTQSETSSLALAARPASP